MYDPQLKQVWRDDTEDLTSEYARLSFGRYAEARKGVMAAFASFFSHHNAQIQSRTYATPKVFLEVYKQMYAAFYPFAAIDFVLDRNDPFGLWHDTESRILRDTNNLEEVAIHDGLSKVFADEPIDVVFPFIENGLYSLLESAREQYGKIVSFQKEHAELYYGNEPLLLRLEGQALSLMKRAFPIEAAKYFPLKEKIKTLEMVLKR